MNKTLVLDGQFIKVETFETNQSWLVTTTVVVTEKESGTRLYADLETSIDPSYKGKEDITPSTERQNQSYLDDKGYTSNLEILSKFTEGMTLQEARALLSTWGLSYRSPTEFSEIYRNSKLVLMVMPGETKEGKPVRVYSLLGRSAAYLRLIFSLGIQEDSPEWKEHMTEESTIESEMKLLQERQIECTLSYGVRYKRDSWTDRVRL